MPRLQNVIMPHLGLGVLCLGVGLLCLAYPLGWTTHNWLLLICLLLIIGGAICHVLQLKHKSKY